MNQILTILEARVAADKWSLLQQEYAAVDKNSLPKSVLNSYLIQDSADQEIWRIITIWENREAIDEYRKSVETPVWILVFRAADAEPTLAISEIIVTK
jgi:quinol monooxygenase YgiN